MADSKERMSPNFAVFNLHVNDAGRRAEDVMRHAMPKYLERVKELETEGNGIMHIFNVPVEPATAAYIALVTAFVNEDRGEQPPAPEVRIRAPVQYLDFTSKPGSGSLWDDQDEAGSRIPVQLMVNELGQVVCETLPR
jgi:hypothetical protein